LFQNAAAQFLFLLFFSVIGQFSSVCASHKWLSEQFPGSEAAFGTISRIRGSFWNNFQDHRQLLVQFPRPQAAAFKKGTEGKSTEPKLADLQKSFIL
jgi:hypothetical protein